MTPQSAVQPAPAGRMAAAQAPAPHGLIIRRQGPAAAKAEVPGSLPAGLIGLSCPVQYRQQQLPVPALLLVLPGPAL